MRRLARSIFTALAVLMLPFAAQAQTPTLMPVRFILDWAAQPHQSPWFLAAERGYFTREGLAVSIDRGFGSGDGMNKVGGGSHDIALGDPNLLLLWNQQNPGRRVVMVYLHMDSGEHSVVALRSRGVNTLQDLAGKRIVRTGTGDVMGPLWPLFTRTHNIDTSRIEWLTVAPNLRDSLLFRGGADAVTAFGSTAYFNLLSLGVRREDIALFSFAENGFDIFGNGLLVTEEFAQRNPELLRRFIRATISGMQDAVADVPAAITATLRRDPTANAQIETDRFRFMLDRSIATPAVRARGISEIPPERLTRVTAFLTEAFEVPASSPPGPIWNPAFLPPLAERQFRR